MKARDLLFIFLSLLALKISAQASSDSPQYLEMMRDMEHNNFFSIQKEFNNYFNGRDQGRGSGFNQFKRWEFIAEPRFYPSGNMFNYKARNLAEYQQYLDNFNLSNLPVNYDPGSWISMGPSNHVLGSGWNGGIGRVNCVEFHPTNPNIYYVGTPAGGLWRNTSGVWVPLTDGISSLGVSGIAIEPDNADHIYIMTGDCDAGNTFSIGVLETWDGGQTWQPTGLSWVTTNFNNGFKLLMNPDNHLILLAATSNGIYKTINGGATWVQVKTGFFMDMEFKPGAPSTVYATTASSFYKSTDTGNTWTLINSGLPVNQSNRIGLAVAPSNSTYVYLLFGRRNLNATQFPYVGCYLSTNSGTTFTLKSNTPNLFGYTTNGSDTADQCTYDLALTVSPILQSNIYFGGINCWRSVNSGLTWTHSSFWYEGTAGEQYTHADIHCLAFNPLNNYLYCCSDGGIYRSTDFGATWSDQSSGLEITQFYRIGMTPSNMNLVVGGTQDNGCNTLDYASGIYRHDRGADGFRCMIDYNNSAIRYATTYEKNYRSTNSGISYTNITPGVVTPNNNIWNTALIMHPTTPSTLYMGHTDIWKSTNSGLSWTSMGTGNVTGKFFQIAHGVNNSNRIFGITNTRVYVTLNNGGIWTNVTGTLPVATASLSYICVDPADATHIWVTFSGYVAGQKVFYSGNSGTTWTNISGSLPNIAANCINYETGSNGGIYVGTDVGIFYRDNTMTDWVPFFNGLPYTIVFEMEINTANNMIIASTYGRGIWRSPLYGHCAATYFLSPNNQVSTTSQEYYAASSSIASTRTIYNNPGADVTYKAGGYVSLLPGFTTQNGSDFHAFIGSCNQAGVPKPNGRIFGLRTAGILQTKLSSQNKH
jgi:photosystem II stability/assembly factor-like uncharacterized protein